VIFAKFIKAPSNWKLEHGAIAAHIQHLLGGRSLVSSVVTPIRTGTASFFVSVLIMVWAWNPLGDQLSLRVVSKETNVTEIDTPFLYVSPSLLCDTRLFSNSGKNPGAYRGIENVITLALMSLTTSKNGTLDLFGNIQIPLLEHLLLIDTADSDG
jgi:hypothetical protein